MGIHKAVQYMAFCDECGDVDQTIIGEDNTRDKTSAIKEFRQRDWKIGKKILCPSCSKEDGR